MFIMNFKRINFYQRKRFFYLKQVQTLEFRISFRVSEYIYSILFITMKLVTLKLKH